MERKRKNMTHKCKTATWSGSPPFHRTPWQPALQFISRKTSQGKKKRCDFSFFWYSGTNLVVFLSKVKNQLCKIESRVFGTKT